MRGRSLVLWICLLSLLAMECPRSEAAEIPDASVMPAEIEKWKPWVLYGHEERFCPTMVDLEAAPQCRWPSRLRLELNGSGGRFSQEWMLYVKGWVGLPGGLGQWPREVKADGRSLPVILHKGSPAVFLQPGKHVVSGGFSWRELPETLPVPPSIGLVALSVDGRAVDHPGFTQDGRLWLQKRAAGPDEADRVEVRVFRLVDDSIPMRVTSLLRLTVSGGAREIRVEGALLEGSIPMQIDSPIPARLGSSGELLLQGRPGRFDVSIQTRFAGPVEKIGPAAAPFGPEIWTFQPQNDLRLVQIEGAPAIDPRQTEVPPDWMSLSTYIIQPGTTLAFKVLRRGDPEPAPDRLSLRRNWWLDFDGGGFTVQDQIDGTLSRQWFLAMNPPLQLGRVSVDGVDQLITEHGPEKKAGVGGGPPPPHQTAG
jgi:hypothetical protein